MAFPEEIHTKRTDCIVKKSTSSALICFFFRNKTLSSMVSTAFISRNLRPSKSPNRDPFLLNDANHDLEIVPWRDGEKKEDPGEPEYPVCANK